MDRFSGGGLGQYFTMRQLARFAVGLLEPRPEDYVVDPTAGSGGFLLESLLQVWHRIERDFAGLPASEIDRAKVDFALQHVYGIEIHEVLARICKLNLLLHHDGHTNIEGGRSCLDAAFDNARLNPPRSKFSVVVGNPPFGDKVKAGDVERLGASVLGDFSIAAGRNKVVSEHVILERSVDLLEPSGRLGLVLPDGLLNNQGDLSNCPQARLLLAKAGRIIAIVSLPDYAFRKSGAQNKTSLLFFRKFSVAERALFERHFRPAGDAPAQQARAVADAYEAAGLGYRVFLAEANAVGYTTVGIPGGANDLYVADADGQLAAAQVNVVLGEYRAFVANPGGYQGRDRPDCMAEDFLTLWRSHPCFRLDPKYFLFKREAANVAPAGWERLGIDEVMERRIEEVDTETDPDKVFKVITLSQTGEIRAREAGKGRNPPEWNATYFRESPGAWYVAHAGDVVYSSIDLWKGCVAVVPEDFDGALVSKEFPIYQVTEPRLLPDFLSTLLRSRYYQRAFRAITTGHSNRRRSQEGDFLGLEICFPPDKEEQRRLVGRILEARMGQQEAAAALKTEMLGFSNVIDGRGDEELPDIAEDVVADGDGGADEE